MSINYYVNILFFFFSGLIPVYFLGIILLRNKYGSVIATFKVASKWHYKLFYVLFVLFLAAFLIECVFGQFSVDDGAIVFFLLFSLMYIYRDQAKIVFQEMGVMYAHQSVQYKNVEYYALHRNQLTLTVQVFPGKYANYAFTIEDSRPDALKEILEEKLPGKRINQ